MFWGDYSQIQVEILLLRTATSKNKYAYYHLLSGVDFPIKSQDEIHKFFDAHPDKEFVGFSKLEKRIYIRRVSKYWFYTKWRRNPNIFIQIIGKLTTIITILLTHRKCEVEFKFGSNWFSITDECARYILSQEKFYHKRFKHTLCADELFVQTLIWNNPRLMNKVFDLSNEYRSCMREVDWNRGDPYVWRIDDFDTLMSSEKLFARKFDEKVDNEIINKLTKVLTPKH